jgi:predicted small metal-binding protein
MRVVECNICGETISAASDEELVGRVKDHLASEHDEEPDAEEVEAMVEEEAYEAMDS